ncbi:phage major capsid protein [Mycolicibacterium palauense]|uniref:phage major capsid protein n=1 Tax=Mycolicibacterium palauense TaxID=2034511 RepID=UPI000BFF07A1|nr:phage major capsid protein [Mycolicibacterium palauense]
MAIETPGGNTTLIYDEIASNIVTGPLVQASTFLSAPGLRIVNASHEMRFPKVGAITAGYVAAGAQVSDGDAAFTEVRVLPSGIKGTKALIKLSAELIRTAGVDLESVIREQMVDGIARAVDAALWNGDGNAPTDDEVLGILARDSVEAGDLDLTDADSIIDGIAKAVGNKVQPNALAMNIDTFTAFRKLKVGASDARYIFDPSNAYRANSFEMFGLPVIITDNVPAESVAVIDFTKIVVVRDQAPTVSVDKLIEYDSTAMLVTTRLDVGLLHDEAVTLLTVPEE